MPWRAARISSGSALLRAATAASLLPEAIALSTSRTALRICVRRALLTAVRRAVWRAAFFADFVLAISVRIRLNGDLNAAANRGGRKAVVIAASRPASTADVISRERGRIDQIGVLRRQVDDLDR